MAAATQIPLAQYLLETYEPDAEFVDGEIEERSVGEYDHSTWQTMIAAFFTMRQTEWGIRARTELRVRVAPERIRAPDVCLLSRDAPKEQIVTYAPLAVFEVLSPEDRITRVLSKLDDYVRMGVGAVWVIEPKRKEYYLYTSGQLKQASLIVLPGTGHQVAMAEIAAMID